MLHQRTPPNYTSISQARLLFFVRSSIFRGFASTCQSVQANPAIPHDNASTVEIPDPDVPDTPEGCPDWFFQSGGANPDSYRHQLHELSRDDNYYSQLKLNKKFQDPTERWVNESKKDRKRQRMEMLGFPGPAVPFEVVESINYNHFFDLAPQFENVGTRPPAYTPAELDGLPYQRWLHGLDGPERRFIPRADVEIRPASDIIDNRDQLVADFRQWQLSPQLPGPVEFEMKEKRKPISSILSLAILCGVLIVLVVVCILAVLLTSDTFAFWRNGFPFFGANNDEEESSDDEVDQCDNVVYEGGLTYPPHSGRVPPGHIQSRFAPPPLMRSPWS